MRGGKLGGTRERMFTNLVQHFGGYKVGWMVREKGRGKRLCYTLATFFEYPSQMYQYPFEGHHTDTSASEHSFGGVAETQPHFSSQIARRQT